MTTQSPEIVFISPRDLTAHPDLAKFPPLSLEQSVTLQGSIERRGILEPLLCTAAHEVYGGRARLHIAQVMELPLVPVMARDEADVLGFAIESRLARGQLTKSGIAMVLFNAHPFLGGSKGGRPKLAGLPPVSKKLAEVPPVSVKDPQEESFRTLASRYQVDRSLFSLLVEARQNLTKTQWADLENKVFALEIPLGRAYAGVLGGAGMAEKGRSETAYFAGWENELMWQRSLFSRSLTTVKNALSRYKDEDKSVKQLVRKEVVALWLQLPEDLRRACREEQG